MSIEPGFYWATTGPHPPVVVHVGCDHLVTFCGLTDRVPVDRVTLLKRVQEPWRP